VSISIRLITADEASTLLPALSALLVDAVAHGASVNFMSDFSLDQASAYWQKQITGLTANDRVWLVAEDGSRVVGTVMCVFASQPNQLFRAELSKMLVHSNQRKRGIGGMLMAAVEKAALAAGKTHLILDTATGDSGDRLYRRMGWKEVGILRGSFYEPDGKLADSTILYKQLSPAPAWR
jgi:predicted GNAT family acetyltransferase